MNTERITTIPALRKWMKARGWIHKILYSRKYCRSWTYFMSKKGKVISGIVGSKQAAIDMAIAAVKAAEEKG